MKVFRTYSPRVVLSLLDGNWKTAPDIARDWEGKRGKGTTNDMPYRKECAQLVKTKLLRVKSLFPGSKRPSARTYALNLSIAAKELSSLWGKTPKDTKMLIKLPIFRDVLKANMATTHRKDAEDLLWNLCTIVGEHILERGTKQDKDLLAAIHKNSIKAKVTPIEALKYLQRVRKNYANAKKAVKHFMEWGKRSGSLK